MILTYIKHPMNYLRKKEKFAAVITIVIIIIIIIIIISLFKVDDK